MEREISLIQLANTIQWWLSYTSAVGRSYVLTESAIKFPLAEYLERTELKELTLEYLHPKLSNRNFDLHFIDSKKKNTAIEFKYVRNGYTRTTAEKQRIFNDLMRLSLYLENDNKCYFLICGAQNDFSTDFKNLEIKTVKSQYIQPRKINQTKINKTIETFYTKWFSFDMKKPVKVIELKLDQTEFGKIYSSFLEEYELAYEKATDEKLNLPKTIETKLIYLSQQIKHETDIFQPANIGIWEVTK
ncbi:hypothetical protein BZARG_1001 [Bizionia argentinensis JUB59]|uniref:Restriction endonuclease n=1 Tax=Bizionia argentinensis JUB59 TaxID=1046627 RepID=G2EBX2_9FLAO|nr:hypothetical protein [Bizionia argentinensis]EGV44166.1 hypothetical protein BZARG_1001 [Bizionia argentinensis JUB59]